LPLALKVQIDERSAREAAQTAQRTFADAGARSSQEFGRAFKIGDALDERALDAAGRRLATAFAKHGKTSAEAFEAALTAEAEKTGLGADAIGDALRNRLAGHGKRAGEAYMGAFTEHLSSVAPQAANALSGITSIGSAMGSVIGKSGVEAAIGVTAIGAAAIETTKHLYDIGETFDNVAKSVEIRTGKMGSDLEALTTSIDNVARRTASSIETIGAIGGSLSQQLNLSGKPLEDLTKQVADLDRMTGESLNVRDFGKVMRAFGESNPGAALDDLYRASTRTGAPVNELVESLKNMGATARSLHMDLGQTSALIDVFDQAGLNADTSIRGLNKAIKEASDKGLDLKTVLGDAITQIKGFLAAGDEQKAQQLGEKLFGTKGAQQFIDAIRQGKLSIDDINKSLQTAGPTIEKMNDATMRWADTWTIVKNRIESAFESMGGAQAFSGWQKILRAGADLLPGGDAPPSVPNGPPAPGAPSLRNLMLPGGGKPGQPAGPGPLYPGLPVPMPVPSGVIAPGPGAGVDVLGALDAKPPKKGLPPAPEVPFGPGYGAPPRPGETSEQYGAEQRVLEERHTVEEARARVTQLEHDNNATADEIQRARNTLLKAQQSEQSAELSLYEQQNKVLTKHVDSMHELGAKLDNDFGISKGLSGIADNLTQFLGNLMMAGPLAALQHMVDASGVKTGAPGAGGLIGMGAVSGAFGPRFMAGGEGGGIGFGAGYDRGGAGGGYGAPGPFGGFPGRPGAFGGPGGGMPGGVNAAGFNFQTPPVDESSIRSWAQQAFGIPNTMGGSSWNNASHVDDGLLHHTGQGGQKHVGSGYAFDFHGTPEQMDQMANWIANNMSQQTLELIHQGAGFDSGREIKNGKFGDVFGPDVDAAHRDHVHWAPTTAPWDAGGPGGGGPLQGPGVIPGPDMSTDASGGVLSAAPSGYGGHAANWNAIAGPEAGGNWQANTGNGYQGGLQFSPGTWSGYGGGQFAPNAAGATPDQQMTVGDRVLSTGFGGHPPQGAGAWPATSGAHPDWFGPGGGAKASPAGFGPDQPGSVQGGPGQGATAIGGQAPNPGIGGGLPGGGGGIAGSIGGEASAIGGAPAPSGMGGGMTAVGGGAAAGAAAGAASMGIGLAAQIAMQEAQRAIQYAGAVGGIATEGLMQTFLPTGGSQLAQNSWLTRIAGGLAGARPQVPNAAGKSTTQSGGTPGPGGAPLPPGGGSGGGQQGGQDATAGGMTHNGDVVINAPSSDPEAIAKKYAEQQTTMYGGQGPSGPGSR
jgi:hypothetical protein